MVAKRCSNCGKEKPLSEFSHNRARPDGYSVWCLTCYKIHRDRFVSLDRKIWTNMSVHELIAAPMPKRTDETWEKVCLAMAYWLQDKTLKPKQVDVIMMRSVENLDWPDIASMAGMSKDTVIYHYRQGIKRLQVRYKELIG